MSERSLFEIVHNPDVLSCLANLSNDEVLTPPEIANKMLDTLPQELFEDPNTKFLDPACKSGVFLREIAKRLDKGLESKIPNLQQRLDHIMHNQLYGIAITELTSLMSRRGVYCSKYPNSKYSVSLFENPEGNIRFRKINHTFKNGKCTYCGASQIEYDRDASLEQHAYEFIHTLKPEEVFNMKFDVIIGNPPYQLNDGGGTGSSAKPIYHIFVEQSLKLNSKYLVMIIPSRWFTSGKGLERFREDMLNNKNIKILHDYVDSSECFPGVSIEGGVCYFLIDKNHNNQANIFTHNNDGKIIETIRYLKMDDSDVFIRNPEMINIIRKVNNLNEEKFSSIVSARNPYNFKEDFIK